MKHLSICWNGGHTHSKHLCHLSQLSTAKPQGRIQSLGPPGGKREWAPTRCSLISICNVNVHEHIQTHTDNNNTGLVGKRSSGVERLLCMNEGFLLQTENRKTEGRENKHPGPSRKERTEGQ